MIDMSKIGKIPIKIPEGVNVEVSGSQVTVAGPKGSLAQTIKKGIEIKILEGNIRVGRKDNSRFVRALHGTARAVLANMVKGVTVGFEKQLSLHGVGFRAKVEGDELFVSVGFSHSVKVIAPPGIKLAISEDKIVVSGIDKKLVGEVADRIRRIKPPEPYKGKGIRYLNEKIRKKVGKKAVATA